MLGGALFGSGLLAGLLALILHMTAPDPIDPDLAPARARAVVVQAALARLPGRHLDREIEAALANTRPDIPLAYSLEALAMTAGRPLAATTMASLAESRTTLKMTERTVLGVMDGIIFGETDDPESLSGAWLIDLLIVGDLRDLGQQGLRAATGREVNLVVVGLAVAGLLFSGTPVDGGLSAIKSLLKADALPEAIATSMKRILRDDGALGRIGDVFLEAGAAMGDQILLLEFDTTEVEQRIRTVLDDTVDPVALAEFQGILEDLEILAGIEPNPWMISRHLRHCRDSADIRLIRSIATAFATADSPAPLLAAIHVLQPHGLRRTLNPPPSPWPVMVAGLAVILVIVGAVVMAQARSAEKNW